LPLSFARRLNGQSFCSAEHRDLHDQQRTRIAFERIMNVHSVPAVAGDGSVAPTQPRSLIRLWIFVVAGVIGIAILGILFFSPASSTSQSAATALARIAPAMAKLDHPVAMEKSRVSVRASGPSWIVACADGKVAFAKLFVAGSRSDFDFTRTAIVRAGNPIATRIRVNGMPVDTPVPATGVAVVDLSPSGARARKGGEPDDCTKGR
jgi:hypothetical protein